MFTQMKKRKYTKTLRAEQQEQTRQRIVDALIALHQEVGPAATSVKAVAEKAGVQRLTVYRHFPDDASLFQACTSHWLQLHPPPEPSAWHDISDPAQRCATALSLFYRYYRRTEAMWSASYRDLDHVQALQPPMAEFEAYLDQIRDEMLKAWQPRRSVRAPLKTTLRHALDFQTWRSLKNQKLGDDKITRLVCDWLRGVTGD